MTAGATPFKAGGDNMVNNVDNLILQGGTTTIDTDGKRCRSGRPRLAGSYQQSRWNHV